MKRRFITLLLVIVMVTMLMVVFTGCTITETITSEKTETVVGSHYIFQTIDVQEYLSFLDSFDETKYEIVDISISPGGMHTAEFYTVTYKTIGE